MFKGFRDFLSRGNVLDLAVAVIIGAAFNSVVGSLVKDIFTPLLGLLGGLPDFSSWKVGPLMLGSFVNNVLSFLFTAAVVYFVLVAPAEALKSATKEKQEAETVDKATEAPPEEIKLLRRIVELLESNDVR